MLDNIELDKKVLNEYLFKVRYISADATSRDFKIKASIVLADANFSNLRFKGTYDALDFTETVYPPKARLHYIQLIKVNLLYTS
jgi:hypothetical protein